MKYLYIVLCLSLLAFSNITRAESYDSDEATVKKATAHTAKVTIAKKSYIVPICFGEDANWSSVKDHYELTPASEAALKSGKSGIMVSSDGKLTWKSGSGSCKK